MTTMKLAYATYSDYSQLAFLTKQFEKLDVQKVILECTLEKAPAQTEFKKMLTVMETGDELLLLTLNHLGENYYDIRDRIVDLHSKEVVLTVLDAPFLVFNTTNPQFNELGFQLLLQILEDIPRMKKVWVKERQLHGIEQAKKKGIYKGRPKMYSESAKDSTNRSVYFQVKDMLLRNFPITSIQTMTGVSRNQIYRIKKELEE